jgi:hypothetical protein
MWEYKLTHSVIFQAWFKGTTEAKQQYYDPDSILSRQPLHN